MGGRVRQQSFVTKERLRQAAFFDAACQGMNGFEGAAYRLLPGEKARNLMPAIKNAALRYFAGSADDGPIQWHRHANHGLSSQVCCVNFLLPLQDRPDVLSKLVGAALDIPPPVMVPVSPERGHLVEFEWIGECNHLGEWIKGRRPTRGANATAADAAVSFIHDGRRETLLIEWKYTEKYGAPVPDKGDPTEGGNATRRDRYGSRMFRPNGPIRSDEGLKLEDFFWEPFYQLLRQQMLAFQMQKKQENGAQRVRVLHISPAANTALKKITSCAFRNRGTTDAFEAFKSVLVRPDDFVARSTESLFGPLVAELGDSDEWAGYLARRYAFINDPINPGDPGERP